jgi:hypothetical protein
MKKLFSVLLITLLVSLFLASTAFASDGDTEGSCRWTLSSINSWITQATTCTGT